MLPEDPKQEDFVKEVEYFFENLFNGKTLTDDLKNHYALFNKNLNTAESAVNIHKIIEKKLDVEAIEFFLRLKNRNNLLTQKLHALTYLVEVRKDFYEDFYLEKDSFIRGFLSLVYFTLRSIFKFIKGSIQVKVYGII